MFDPLSAHRIAIMCQQQILDDAAGDRRGIPDDVFIRRAITQEILTHYVQQNPLGLFAHLHPLHLLRLLRLLRPMRAPFVALAGALRKVNTRQVNRSAYAAERCDLEGECAS